MSWWRRIFGGVTSRDLANVVTEAGKLHFSDQEKSDADLSDTNAARAFAAPGEGGGYFNDLVNACNRLPRPVITFWMIGGISGWWELPEPKSIDPQWWTVFIIVITFWFGGRVIVKDAPAMIAALIALRAKWKRVT